MIITRTSWLLVTVFCFFSIAWYLLGTTANFQRGIDLISTLIFIVIWIPALILVIVSIILMVKRWRLEKKESHISLWILISFMLVLSFPLIQSVNTSGWLHDKVRSDPLRLTSDGKYEYRIQLINLFQKNSKERLYLRHISTGVERYIQLDLNIKEIHGIGIPSDKDWSWGTLSPTADSSIYDLITTKRLPVEIKRIRINVEEETTIEIN